ncbi:twin transmembrane helix small protein [Algicella marina]|uniref:Twin transmembrane helix small protein n=1 Tax=Algicella marina TaxID=2683284 RepID=A0A6P1T5T0_9RHOB|nr:twin transmembrane helix small protein [Algicella marina]QHQ37115.1 twin transmembrane helix small protein [Algicella marina]
MTSNPMFYVTLIACLVVVVVLMVGIGGFAKGGDFNRKYANKIMRLRILMQFIAVVLIVVFAFFFRGTN